MELIAEFVKPFVTSNELLLVVWIAGELVTPLAMNVFSSFAVPSVHAAELYALLFKTASVTEHERFENGKRERGVSQALQEEVLNSHILS